MAAESGDVEKLIRTLAETATEADVEKLIRALAEVQAAMGIYSQMKGLDGLRKISISICLLAMCLRAHLGNGSEFQRVINDLPFMLENSPVGPLLEEAPQGSSSLQPKET